MTARTRPSAADTRAARAAENRRGILCMAGGMASLVLNDSLMKYVGQSLSVAQMISVRGIMAMAMVVAVARALGATVHLPLLLDRRVGARAVFDALGTVLYIAALMHLPIGNATAINLAAPLILAFLAVIFLGEKPGLHRWLAIGAGFVGVILVIQPRIEGFNAWALVCLAGTAAGSVRDLLTRRIPSAVPAILITFAGIALVTVLALATTLIEGWQPVGLANVALLGVAAALLATGYYLLVNSMRHGEISIVAPFRYAGLLVALATGFVIWGEVPGPLAWSGIALLLAAGIYLLHDERRRRDGDLPVA